MNLVLSTVCRLDYKSLQPFVRSLRECSQATDIVFFTSHVSAIDRQQLKAAGVHTIPFFYPTIRMRQPASILWPVAKILFRLSDDGSYRRAVARPFANLFFLRNMLFLDYLMKHRNEYENVFLTDCRDVVFQGDPFHDLDAHSGVIAFLEHGDTVIGESPANRSMVHACVGSGGLAEVANKVPSCAGTVLGTAPAVSDYLRVFVEWIPRLRRMRMIPGDDQGLHNYLVHTGRIPNMRIIDNRQGPVATLGCVPDDQINLDGQGHVIQEDGRPFAVLHQYDRKSRLRKKWQPHLES